MAFCTCSNTFMSMMVLYCGVGGSCSAGIGRRVGLGVNLL